MIGRIWSEPGMQITGWKNSLPKTLTGRAAQQAELLRFPRESCWISEKKSQAFSYSEPAEETGKPFVFCMGRSWMIQGRFALNCAATAGMKKSVL